VNPSTTLRLTDIPDTDVLNSILSGSKDLQYLHGLSNSIIITTGPADHQASMHQATGTRPYSTMPCVAMEPQTAVDSQKSSRKDYVLGQEADEQAMVIGKPFFAIR
jgi:hypothetical protein